jgi:IS30 family transposase
VLQMTLYKQLSFEERERIAQLRQSKTSLSEIADKLGRHKSTISRELKRNEAPPGQYWPDTAEIKRNKRRRRGCILNKNKELQDYVRTKLMCHFWTPEQIAGRLKKDGMTRVSHETIYSWLYKKEQKDEKLWKFLPRHKSTRGLRKSKSKSDSRIQNRISIHQRPNIDQEFGHWEGDLMAFKKNSQYIVVLRERKSMLTLSVVLDNKKAEVTKIAILHLLKKIPTEAKLSITFDNGTEFANHDKLGIKTYFCDPYASWQKGGVENSNGRLRRDLPRYVDVKKMSKDDFDETIENYNTTPRKNLTWMTPIEAFNKNLQPVALQT